MGDAAFLAELCHHRWAVRVLARLCMGGGGRTAELARALGGSRGGVGQAMAALIDLGLAARNAGHGHPLRPEYVATARGERVGAEAERIVGLTRRWSIERYAFRKWPLPVAYGLGEEGARFSELSARLPGITDRALSDALRALAASRLAERVVHADRPPAVEYRPTERSVELLPPLQRLVEAA